MSLDNSSPSITIGKHIKVASCLGRVGKVGIADRDVTPYNTHPHTPDT